MDKKYIAYFREIGKQDIELAGGKGANLGEMSQMGFPVPPGFCVTATAYLDFVHHHALLPFITQATENLDINNLAAVGKAIRDHIQSVPIPEPIRQEIVEAFKQTGPDYSYAVRSSAVAEDLPQASFAGQQDTYLNIIGETQLLNRIRDCWASLFTDRAMLYRQQNRIGSDQVMMAVVVQKMVFAEASGIMFTADPVSGRRDMISIEAGFGLGEVLVSGLITPDRYLYNKRKKCVVEEAIAAKSMKLVARSGGGTDKIILPQEEGRERVLTSNMVQTLVEYGQALEEKFAGPQDVEWCLEAGNFYLVQSRPITALFPLPVPLPQDDALHCYICVNHVQMMTEPISPLGIDMLCGMFGIQSKKNNYFIKTAGGRLYIDLSEILSAKHFGKLLTAFLANADYLMHSGLATMMDREEFNQRIKKNPKTPKALKKFLKPLIKIVLQRIVYRSPEGIRDQVNRYIAERLSAAEEEMNCCRPGRERIQAAFKIMDFRTGFHFFLPVLAPGIISFKLLFFLEEKWLGKVTYADHIVQGMEGNLTTEMGLLTGDLADEVRKSPLLTEMFSGPDYGSLLECIEQLTGQETFRRRWDGFMDKYGMRGAGEIDLARPRWRESPEPLGHAIMAMVQTSSEQQHRKEFARTVNEAEKAMVRLVEEVRHQQGRIKARMISRVIKVLRHYLPLREHPKYLIVNLLMIAKRYILTEGENWVRQGRLAEAADIFYLNYQELLVAVDTNEPLHHLVSKRKEEYDFYQRLNPPRVLTSDGEEIKADYQTDQIPAGALAGLGGSAGVVEGVAKVITDPRQGAVNKGEILVAPFTDPGWTPLFINAAGLVTEVGGLLTHGTVVAREYGIPAVVGIVDATKKITSGQKIVVDGNRGLVMIKDQ